MTMNDGFLDDLPKIHPRADIVAKALADHSVMLMALRKEYGLTASEEFLLLARASEILAQGCIVLERREREEAACRAAEVDPE